MIAEARKRCHQCGETLHLSSFRPNSRNKDGLCCSCVECRDYKNKHVRSYRQKIGFSVIRRAAKYGLTFGEVRAMMAIPSCQSCGASLPDSRSKKFDHCHVGGHLRGVICNACNTACQGTSEEAIVRLQCCIAYLQRDLERTA